LEKIVENTSEQLQLMLIIIKQLSFLIENNEKSFMSLC